MFYKNDIMSGISVIAVSSFLSGQVFIEGKNVYHYYITTVLQLYYIGQLLSTITLTITYLSWIQ